jgi:hypothetical protein
VVTIENRSINLKGVLAFTVVNLLRYQKSTVHDSQRRYERNR